MRKKLILCRHAEAKPQQPGKEDFDRELTPHGKWQAQQVGNWLAENKLQPDLVHASSAKRALQTAATITETLKSGEPVLFQELYDAPPAHLLAHVNTLPDSANTVLLVAHNPGISALASVLSGRIHSLEPAGFAVLNFSVDSWAEVSAGTGY